MYVTKGQIHLQVLCSKNHKFTAALTFHSNSECDYTLFIINKLLTNVCNIHHCLA